MARKGRRRASTKKREANGRASRAGLPRHEMTVTEALRTKIIAIAYGRKHSRTSEAADTHDELNSQFGIWIIMNEIPQASYAAGVKWRELHESYQAAIEARRPRSAVLEPSFGSAYDVDTERGMVVAEREKKVTARYIKTRDALAAYGDDVLSAVSDLVIERRSVDWCRQGLAKFGLQVLAKEFGLIRSLELQ